MSLVGDPVIYDDPLMTPLGTSTPYTGPVEVAFSSGQYEFINPTTDSPISGGTEESFTGNGVTNVGAGALGFTAIADSAGGAIFDLAGNFIGYQGGETIGGNETVAQFIAASETDYSNGGGTVTAAQMLALDTAAEGSAPQQTGTFTGTGGLLVYATDTGGTGSVSATGGATTLTQLTDVTLTNPVAGQVLELNSAGQWVNANLASSPSLQMIEQVIAQDLGHAFQSMGVYGSQTPEVIAALGHYL